MLRLDSLPQSVHLFREVVHVHGGLVQDHHPLGLKGRIEVELRVS